MATADGIGTNSNTVLQNISSSSNSTNSGQLKGKNQAIGKEEFLNMLVTQLKNQDPMDPMNNDQFAVNLAQFSQLEQLISINRALTGSGTGGSSAASLTGYLGQEIAYKSDTLTVKNNDAGRVHFNLGSDAKNVRVELLNPDGSVKEKIELGEVASGRHSAVLSGITTASGEYGFRVVATGQGGQESEVAANASGIVTGFIPGDDPTLLIGDREVKPVDIVEVTAGMTPSGNNDQEQQQENAAAGS